MGTYRMVSSADGQMLVDFIKTAFYYYYFFVGRGFAGLPDWIIVKD